MSNTDMTKLFLTTAYCAAQLVSVAQSVASIERELIDRSNELMRAVERQDRAALELLVADEFLLEVPGDTAFTSRAEWIGNAVNLKWEGFKFHNVKVRSFGEVAVVSSALDFKVTTGIGIPISSDVQVTDVWVRRDGQWLIAVRQLGEDSLSGTVRTMMGFFAALVLCFLVRLIVRIRRRAKARKAPVVQA
ncbi:MAG: nuclear transport factor 2 family protein [Flavobacteriales bacterium]|nr:nuclear transport factor 2 family protein [Flavobacteriales bacterium]